MALLPPEKVTQLHACYGKPVTIDDVVRLRARDQVQSPILAYPKSDSLTDYELFSGRDLDQFVDQACWSLVDGGFLPTQGGDDNDGDIVALFADSDLCYSMTMLALLRMGYKVMTISTRLGPLACKSLLDRVECKTVIYGSTPKLRSVLKDISSDKPHITLRPILSRDDFDKPGQKPCEPFVRPRADDAVEERRVALIMHSSGSTGYPKPLFQCHAGVLGDLLTGMGCRAFNPLPWFHLHGLLTSLQAMYMRQTAYLWNARLPLTAENIIIAIRAVKPEIFHGVPYTVKLLSEVPEGIELLRDCKHVTSGGARPPDELGDKLVREGVHFSTTFGLTETCHIGDSMRRKPGDDGWDYLRLHSHVIPHMIFNKIENSQNGDNEIETKQVTYEGVFLKSHPALLMSNSDDPPGSYHSGDIFIPHPSIPNAWKYIARSDDCITLANGEKINPMAMEGVLRQHPLAKDALMFGVDQPVPGMLIFQSSRAANMSDEEYMENISGALHEANGFADAFARVSRDMVVLIPPGVKYPTTDKNNIIRAATYRMFDKQIQSAYEEGGDTSGHTNGGASSNVKLQLDVTGLQDYIMGQFEQYPQVKLASADDDFFSAGVDSLMAIQVQRNLQRHVDVGGVLLPNNIIYDARNASSLAEMLHNLRMGGPSQDTNGHSSTAAKSESQIPLMESLIDKYTKWEQCDRGTQETPKNEVVLLTGATGALGAHLLHTLLQRPDVQHVYCLVRSSPSLDPRERVLESLRLRGINPETLDPNKTLGRFSAHHTPSFGDNHLGLSPELYEQLQNQVTLIIHAAWPVHFKLPLATFEPHIAGTHNLLQLSLQVPWREPARVLFASSIATAYATPRQKGSPALIAEGPIPSLSHSLATGYAQSKLVCERICEGATASMGANVAVLRIGQFVGDTHKGIWNSKEAIPLMVQSALVLHCLPLLDAEKDMCEWMPIDTMAEVCLETGDYLKAKTMETPKHASYFNLVSRHSHSWNNHVLPLLKQAGLEFETVPFATWLSKLQSYSAGDTKTVAEEQLPAMKLAEYYQELYGIPLGETSIARFELDEGCKHIAALRECPSVVDGDLIAKFLRTWMQEWTS